MQPNQICHKIPERAKAAAMIKVEKARMFKICIYQVDVIRKKK
jgi:hypothetical protein